MGITEATHAPVAVRPMTRADVRPAVKVHLAAFPGFFLSALGPAFLRELYQGFLRDDGVALVAEDGAGALLGIIAGTCQPEGFFRRLLQRRWWAFGLASVPLLLRRPGALFRVFRALRYRGDGSPEVQGTLLSTICVDPCRQRGGVGSALVRAFLREAAARGAALVYLMADARDEKANGFYRRLGFTAQDTVVTPEGRAMNRYVLMLQGDQPASSDPPAAAEHVASMRHEVGARPERARDVAAVGAGRSPAVGGE